MERVAARPGGVSAFGIHGPKVNPFRPRNHAAWNQPELRRRGLFLIILPEPFEGVVKGSEMTNRLLKNSKNF